MSVFSRVAIAWCAGLSLIAGAPPAPSAAMLMTRPSECVVSTGKPYVCAHLVNIGHRCREYDPAMTNENTLAALREVAKIPRTECEIDTWQGVDGTQFVFHDKTCARLCDPRTTKGLPKYSWEWTSDDVHQIRTLGGQRIPTLYKFIKVAGELQVPLVVEVKNRVSDPALWVTRIARLNAQVRWYAVPSAATCGLARIDRLRDAGAVTGVKQPAAGSPCILTPTQVAEHGSFVGSGGLGNPDRVAAYRAAGVEPLPRVAHTKTKWARLVKAGVRQLIVSQPAKLQAWVSKR